MIIKIEKRITLASNFIQKIFSERPSAETLGKIIVGAI
jgi:hypothetical protein